MAIETLKQFIDVDARRRSFLLTRAVDQVVAAPLLIALHGSTQRGSIMRRTSEFDRLAEIDGVVVVYPDAVDGIWRDGRDDDGGIDDVHFIDELIDHCVRHFAVDARRVYLVGVSNGGFMTQRFVCEMPWRLRAAASVIANLGSFVAQTCWPQDVISLFLLAATADPVVPFAGGYVMRVDGNRYRGEVLSFADSVAHWRRVGRWDQSPGQARVELGDGIAANEQVFSSPLHDKRLKVVAIEGGGHHWFGRQMPAELDEVFGPRCNAYKTSDEIWRFFQSLEP